MRPVRIFRTRAAKPAPADLADAALADAVTAPRRENPPDGAGSATGSAAATADSGQTRAPWPDLSTLLDGSPPGRLPQRQARLWSLVLRSRRVPHRVRSLPGGYTIQVPARFARQAVEEIHLYQRENVSPHPDIPLPPAQERARPTVAAMLALCAFFALAHKPFPAIGMYPHHWRAAGIADAAAILSGELWRCVTALSLHADPAHMASNAVVGGAFLILLARRVGSGWAWLAAALAGALGNLLNALAHAAIGAPEHLSLGFSTAVFGAAGVLAGLKAARGEGDLRARLADLPGGLAFGAGGNSVADKHVGAERSLGAAKVWLTPVGAALALLATLGAGGEDTDLGAHFFGLVAGLALGWALGRISLRLGRPDDWARGQANRVAALACGGLFLLAWAAAFART